MFPYHTKERSPPNDTSNNCQIRAEVTTLNTNRGRFHDIRKLTRSIFRIDISTLISTRRTKSELE